MYVIVILDFKHLPFLSFRMMILVRAGRYYCHEPV